MGDFWSSFICATDWLDFIKVDPLKWASELIGNLGSWCVAPTLCTSISLFYIFCLFLMSLNYICSYWRLISRDSEGPSSLETLSLPIRSSRSSISLLITSLFCRSATFIIFYLISRSYQWIASAFVLLSLCSLWSFFVDLLMMEELFGFLRFLGDRLTSSRSAFKWSIAET